MGGDYKTTSAGLAAKAASSVIKSSINKDKKKADDKKQLELSGKAADAAGEAEELADRIGAQINASE